jgi:hypothetical protein
MGLRVSGGGEAEGAEQQGTKGKGREDLETSKGSGRSPTQVGTCMYVVCVCFNVCICVCVCACVCACVRVCEHVLKCLCVKKRGCLLLRTSICVSSGVRHAPTRLKT